MGIILGRFGACVSPNVRRALKKTTSFAMLSYMLIEGRNEIVLGLSRGAQRACPK